MSHDPLCRWGAPGARHARHDCDMCTRIASVRADEREQAAERVREADGTCFTDYCTEAAAAAARGEA